LEGSNCDPIEILSQHLLGGTEEYHIKTSENSRFLGQYLNLALPKYKAAILIPSLCLLSRCKFKDNIKINIEKQGVIVWTHSSDST
jgi:hypothetical protein